MSISSKSCLLALACLLSLACYQATASPYTVDTNSKHIVDANGRISIFHGVNAIYKLFPFVPIYTHFDLNASLSDADFVNLRSWGMNVVRLYVSWEGTNTAKGTFNTTYLEEVRKVVRKAAEYKIDILLDAHEDAVARRYCGEGFPDWAVQGSNDTFPLPLTVSLDFNETGFPTLDSCLRINFLHYNTAFDAQYAWQKLYENIDGVQDQFAEFWKVVASYFKDEPNVIGYEVINEPYIANIYADIKYKDPKNNDIDHLTPLYDKVNEKIREVDNNTIIFFEPTVHDENIGIYKAPGGETFNNRSVFSYHVYCMNVTAEGEPTNLTECHKQDDKAFYYQYQVAQDLGLASFLTEFGALSNSYRSSEEVEYITNMAETHFQSWAYWQYKYYEDITTDAQPGSTESFYFDNGTVQATKVKALARPYAYRICGEPVSTRFTAENGIFELSYKPGNCSGLNTEVYLGEELHYPNGFQVNLGNCNACTLRSIDNHDSYYEILVEQPPQNGIVTLIVYQSQKFEQDFLVITE